MRFIPKWSLATSQNGYHEDIWQPFRESFRLGKWLGTSRHRDLLLRAGGFQLALPHVAQGEASHLKASRLMDLSNPSTVLSTAYIAYYIHTYNNIYIYIKCIYIYIIYILSIYIYIRIYTMCIIMYYYSKSRSTKWCHSFDSHDHLPAHAWQLPQ